jgi:hypothetical protein
MDLQRMRQATKTTDPDETISQAQPTSLQQTQGSNENQIQKEQTLTQPNTKYQYQIHIAMAPSNK